MLLPITGLGSGETVGQCRLVADHIGPPADDWNAATFLVSSTRVATPGGVAVVDEPWALFDARPLGDGTGTRLRVDSAADGLPCRWPNYPSGKYRLKMAYTVDSEPQTASMGFGVNSVPEPQAAGLLWLSIVVAAALYLFCKADRNCVTVEREIWGD